MDSATEQGRPHAWPEAATYRFAGFTLDPARGILLRPGGAEMVLRPKCLSPSNHFICRAAWA